MSATEPFTGLSLSVFTAFGWAGEENAIKFAISQLEFFISALHQALSKEAKAEFPYFGLDREAKTVYLATHSRPDDGVYITFNARPSSLDIRLTVTEKLTLNRGYKAAEKNPADWHRTLLHIGEEWTIHYQQSLVDEESGEISHYTDLCKENLGSFSMESCKTATERAAFLNGEPKWLIPLVISRRMSADQAAAMASKLPGYIAQEIDRLLPVVNLFSRPGSRISAPPVNSSSGKSRTPAAPKATPSSATLTKIKEGSPTSKAAAPAVVEEEISATLTYVSQLKPLHIRKGFINLAPKYWPFFALNARTGSRAVTLYYGGKYDKDCTVWNVQPDNLVRIVLSDPVQRWLEETFRPEEQISVTATKLTEDDIQITLKAVA